MADCLDRCLAVFLVFLGIFLFVSEGIGGLGSYCPQCEAQGELPFGIDVKSYSLPALAVILGLADGFNPCAMWALVFLIGIVIGLHDRRKLWVLVGAFVASSGVLYFLFMTAWLNAFLLIGYFRAILIAVGLLAVWIGVGNLRSFFKKGQTCPLPSKRKAKLAHKMERYVKAPLSAISVAGIIALAFVVNLIEFVCSSFIPVVFTQTLSLQKMSVASYYAHIALYDLFYMLDDLMIFSFAAFSASCISQKYARYCHLAGGIILFALGILLLFFPQILR